MLQKNKADVQNANEKYKIGDAIYKQSKTDQKKNYSLKSPKVQNEVKTKLICLRGKQTIK